jgi:hypothetical protein
MSKLVLSANGLLTKESGKVLAEMLKHNSVLQELDVSDNYTSTPSSITDGPGFAQELAVGLSDNGVLTALNLAKNHLGSLRGKAKYGNSDPERDDDWEWHTDMSGVVAIADVFGDMRALSVTNVMGNKIGKEQLAKLQEIMRSKPNLVSLCGIADDATGADLSGLNMDADDAIVLASELPDKGALSKLTFNGGVAKYGDWIEGDTAILESSMTRANYSNKKLGVPGAMLISAWLSSGKNKGALTKLDISNNSIEQGEALQQIIEYCNTKGIELDNHESESGDDY